MSVSSLEIENFRNQSKATFKFSEKTLLTGPNGSGKTSILEAIRLISVGKSFRTGKVDDLILFDQPYFRLNLIKAKDVFEFFYGTQFNESLSVERRLTANGKAVQYMDFLGEFPTVVFSAKDVDIITEQPSLRRQFIDGILWQVDPEFRRSQLEYNRVLRERSQLLFMLKISRASVDELYPWDELITALSEKIREARKALVDFINEQITELEDSVPGKIKARLEIDVSKQKLEELREQEIRLGHNLFGPHRDELVISSADRLARRFASRGQARSIIALLKAIEARYLAKYAKNKPVILLDDVISELDVENIEWLFSIFSNQYQLISTAVSSDKSFANWDEVKL